MGRNRQIFMFQWLYQGRLQGIPSQTGKSNLAKKGNIFLIFNGTFFQEKLMLILISELAFIKNYEISQ